MTQDEFAGKYDVHKRIAEGPVRSYFGRSRSAKVVALVHYLDGGNTPENAARLAQVHALAASRGHLVLDVCDVEGTPVVVTRFILNFTTFDAWLAMERAAPSPPPAPPAAGVPYDISTAPTVRTERVVPPPSADSRARVPEAKPPGPAAGEFTKLFHPPAPPPDTPPPASATPSPAAPPPPPGPPGKAPGEFTGLFSAGGDAPPPAGSAPAKGAGEFTSLFSAGADQPPSAPPARGPAPAAPTPPAAAPRRGEFTALFGKRATPEGASPLQAPLPGTPPARPATPPELSPFASPQDGGDDLYRRLHSGPGLPAVPPPPQAMPASGPPSPQPPAPTAPPGDFTRVFGAAPAVPPTSMGPPPHAPGSFSTAQPPPSEVGAGAAPQLAPDYLARLQGAPPAPPAGPAAPSVPPPVPTAAPGRGVASEFTRALRRISASILPPTEPDAPPAKAPAGAPRSALPWMIAMLGVLAVVAVGIVLYFVLTAG